MLWCCVFASVLVVVDMYYQFRAVLLLHVIASVMVLVDMDGHISAV